MYACFPVPQEGVLWERVLTDYARAAIVSTVVGVLGNILSQTYEIRVGHEHAVYDWGRVKRMALLNATLYPVVWNLGWYGGLLPAAATWIQGICPALPLWLIKAGLDQGPWTFLFSLWVGYFAISVVVERQSMEEARHNTFKQYWDLFSKTNLPFWLPIQAVSFGLFPDYAFLVTQLVVIPWAALMAYTAHEKIVINLWDVYKHTVS